MIRSASAALAESSAATIKTAAAKAVRRIPPAFLPWHNSVKAPGAPRASPRARACNRYGRAAGSPGAPKTRSRPAAAGSRPSAAAAAPRALHTRARARRSGARVPHGSSADGSAATPKPRAGSPAAAWRSRRPIRLQGRARPALRPGSACRAPASRRPGPHADSARARRPCGSRSRCRRRSPHRRRPSAGPSAPTGLRPQSRSRASSPRAPRYRPARLLGTTPGNARPGRPSLAAPPSNLEQLPHLLDARLPDPQHLLVVALVEPAEAAVADHVAQLLGPRHQVGGLVQHRLRLGRRLDARQPRPGKVLAPVRVRVLGVDRHGDLPHLGPDPPGVENRLGVWMIGCPLARERP